MNDLWEYQVRINMDDEIAEMARNDTDNATLKPLMDILNKHRASLKCQYDAFAGYVAEAEAHGVEKYPLYAWTKETIGDPAKKANTSNPSRFMSMAMKSTPRRMRTRSRPTYSPWSAES